MEEWGGCPCWLGCPGIRPGEGLSGDARAPAAVSLRHALPPLLLLQRLGEPGAVARSSCLWVSTGFRAPKGLCTHAQCFCQRSVQLPALSLHQ